MGADTAHSQVEEAKKTMKREYSNIVGGADGQPAVRQTYLACDMVGAYLKEVASEGIGHWHPRGIIGIRHNLIRAVR